MTVVELVGPSLMLGSTEVRFRSGSTILLLVIGLFLGGRVGHAQAPPATTIYRVNISCTSVTPLALTFPGRGGTRQVVISEVNESNPCHWVALPTQPWLSIPPPHSGVGTQAIEIVATRNPLRRERTARVHVGGYTVTITQRRR